MFAEWPRCIVCVDMNAFFASVEQLLQPSLRHKPIAITNGNHGSCIITASYQARAYGVKTGMSFAFARLLCPSLIQVASRSAVYEHFSKRLMQILYQEFTPDIEVFSVDEAFLDMTHVYHRYPTPMALAQAIADCVMQTLSLPCSVGIAGDKTTAKYAAKRYKPQGVAVIEPAVSQQILAPLAVSELCGIGPRTQKYLAKFGAQTCGSVLGVPVSMLSKKFGIKGQRLWLMCAGRDPDEVRSTLKPAQTMGHSKILPPGVNTRSKLLGYLDTMAFKLIYRMLIQHYYAAHYVCKITFAQRAYGYEMCLDEPQCRYALLAKWLQFIGEDVPMASSVRRVQITALDLTLAVQKDLFAQSEAVVSPVEQLVSRINARFGQSAIVPARLTTLFKVVQASNVISPSWKGAVPVQTKVSIWD